MSRSYLLSISVMTYSNGDIRSGYFNKTWMGKVMFYEHGQFTPWIEFWKNGNYESQVDIFKSVIDNYQGIKGQLISKGNFAAFKSTKKPTIFLQDFCPK